MASTFTAAQYEQIVLVGAPGPGLDLAYQGQKIPPQWVATLASTDQDVLVALRTLPAPSRQSARSPHGRNVSRPNAPGVN